MRRKPVSVSRSAFYAHLFSPGSWLHWLCLLRLPSPNLISFLRFYEIAEISTASLHHIGCPLSSFLASLSVPLKAWKGLHKEKYGRLLGSPEYIFPLSRVIALLFLDASGGLAVFIHTHVSFSFCFVFPIFLTLQQKHCPGASDTNVAKRRNPASLHWLEEISLDTILWKNNLSTEISALLYKGNKFPLIFYQMLTSYIVSESDLKIIVSFLWGTLSETLLFFLNRVKWGIRRIF